MFSPELMVGPEVTFEETVRHPQPIGNGQHKYHSFRLTFAVLPTEQAEEIVKELLGVEADEELSNGERREKMLDQLGRIVVGWPEKSIGDKNGKPVPYTRQNLALLLSVPGLLSRIIQTYSQAMNPAAQAKRRRGN